MKLTIATVDGGVVQVDVEPSDTVLDAKELAAVGLSIPVEDLELSFRGEVIPDNAKLEDVGMEDNDLVEARLKRRDSQRSSSQRSSQRRSLTASLRNSLRGLSNQEMVEQAYIESQINARNVAENMALAMEENPESFASVYMLYIDAEVNGVEVKTFVDSGAQTTVMSRSCVERCGLMRLVDQRFAGVAVGVGHARILGRVHIAPIKIGSQLYNCSFTVLDTDQKVELLLGLDMLKRFQCLIDLKNDCLHIGEPPEVVPFLSEAELPEHARLR